MIALSSILLSLGVFSGAECFVRLDTGADLLLDDLLIGGGLIGGVFFGLAGTRGILKTVAFLGVTTRLSVSAFMDVSRLARLPPGITLTALTILRLITEVLSSSCISFPSRSAIESPRPGTSLLSARVVGEIQAHMVREGRMLNQVPSLPSRCLLLKFHGRFPRWSHFQWFLRLVIRLEF